MRQHSRYSLFLGNFMYSPFSGSICGSIVSLNARLIFHGLIGLFLLLPILAAGQQAAQSSLAVFNPFQWNPGFAGIRGNVSANLGARLQWTGLEGGPSTQFAGFHAPFEIFGGGLGIKLENDAFGAALRQRAVFTFNYHLPVGEGLLGLGLGAGVVQRVLDGESLRTPQGIYQGTLIDHQDALLVAGRMSGAAPTIEAGVYFQSRRLELGISALNLNRPGPDLGTLKPTEQQTFFLNTLVNLPVNSNLELTPALWIRSDGIQTQTDLSMILRYKDNIMAGTSLRGYSASSLDALAFIAGFRLSEKLQVAYAYDLSLSALRQVNNGTHEILLSYDLPRILGRLRLPPIIYNPRNL